jgi:ankyrin repeat protein
MLWVFFLFLLWSSPHFGETRPLARDKATELYLEALLASDFTKMAKILSESPINPNGKNKDGATLLSIAIQKGQVSVVTDLLKRGADPNFPVDQQAFASLRPLKSELSGQSMYYPLEIAQLFKSPATVDLLLKSGAKITPIFLSEVDNPKDYERYPRMQILEPEKIPLNKNGMESLRGQKPDVVVKYLFGRSGILEDDERRENLSQIFTSEELKKILSADSLKNIQFDKDKSWSTIFASPKGVKWLVEHETKFSDSFTQEIEKSYQFTNEILNKAVAGYWTQEQLHTHLNNLQRLGINIELAYFIVDHRRYSDNIEIAKNAAPRVQANAILELKRLELSFIGAIPRFGGREQLLARLRARLENARDNYGGPESDYFDSISALIKLVEEHYPPNAPKASSEKSIQKDAGSETH